MNVTTELKEQILLEIEKAIEKGISQAKLSEKTKVNAGIISCIKTRKWDNTSNGVPVPIKDWLALADYFRIGRNSVQTTQYVMIRTALMWAKTEGLASVIDGHTGCGKTHTIKEFVKDFPQSTYLVTCARDFTAKNFIYEVALAVGADSYGTQYELRKNITIKLASELNPILILDEAENLTDQGYAAIKALVDALEGRLAIVLVGANEYWAYLNNRARKGGLSAKCFPQVVSRFRANVTKIAPITLSDVKTVAQSAGIDDSARVKELFNTSQDYRSLFGALKKQAREAQLNVAS